MAKPSIFVQVIANLKFAGKMEAIKDRVGRKEFMLKIGEQIKTLVYGDTKSGKGVEGETATTLTALSPMYIQYRRKKAKSRGFTAGRFFNPSKSNLTFTGQMLESLDVDARQNFVKVYVRDTKRNDSRLTNSFVAEKVAENGRPFMGLTKRNKRTIDKEVERETRAIVRRELARK
jgi:hypothetical protein